MVILFDAWQKIMCMWPCIHLHRGHLQCSSPAMGCPQICLWLQRWHNQRTWARSLPLYYRFWRLALIAWSPRIHLQISYCSGPPSKSTVSTSTVSLSREGEQRVSDPSGLEIDTAAATFLSFIQRDAVGLWYPVLANTQSEVKGT